MVNIETKENFMASPTMWLTFELEAITDLLSKFYQLWSENALYSTKIRASTKLVHNHRVMLESHGYPGNAT